MGRALRLLDLVMKVLALLVIAAGIFYIAQGNYQTGVLLVVLSLIVLLYSPKPPSPITPTFEVSTEILCESCGYKKVRPFRKGDYVFKEDEVCPRCKKPMVVTAIFRKPTKEELE